MQCRLRFPTTRHICRHRQQLLARHREQLRQVSFAPFWIISSHNWLVIFYFSNRKLALIYSLELVLAVVAVVVVVVVVVVALVHPGVSAKKDITTHCTALQICLSYFVFYLTEIVFSLWVRRPLWVNQLGQLSLPSLRGR